MKNGHNEFLSLTAFLSPQNNRFQRFIFIYLFDKIE